MTLPQIFSFGVPPARTVHALRRTHKGIQYLKQTGQFKAYMQKYLDAKKRPFIAWDGEGWNDPYMYHQYMLLQNSLGERIHSEKLASIECLEMILKTGGENPGAIHVIYGGGYDATMILADLPYEMQLQLRDNNEVTWSVRGTQTTRPNRYTFNYLPHKWLEIRGYDWYSEKNVRIKIYDVMTFFQSSFIKALESRGLDVPEVIKSGKAGRSDFLYSDIEEVSEYCQMEVELLVELCNVLRDEFDEAGIWVSQFHGPGAVASAVMKAEKIRPHMGPAPTREIEEILSKAYYGGHFEQYKAGHYQGKVYLNDINSAYPYHIAQLPSMEGAWWEKVDKYDPDAMGMWYCTYDDDDEDYVKPHPLPWRGKGGAVGFPAHNVGTWVWHPEAKYATEVHHGYILHIESDVKPFAFVGEMYKLRKKWQDEGRGGERALKLAMNSLYGKLCQLVGGSENYGGRPPWHNLAWGGIITSSTRAQILAAVALDPGAIIAVETDSVASTRPLALDIGDGLGQWGASEYDWITYIQSGIYFTSDPKKHSKSKTRGIDVTQLLYQDVLAFLDSDQETPLKVTTKLFIGLGNPRMGTDYGQWQSGTKDVKVAGQKRIHVPGECRACDQGLSMATNLHDLIANPLYGNIESVGRPLPWLTNEELEPLEQDYEMEETGGAVAEYENTRHGGG